MDFDVIIIGGGIVGAATARVLSQFKGHFALIEQGADVCMGASKANSGIVHAGFDAKPGSQKAKYNVLGAQMYPTLCEALGVPYRQTGALVTAYDETGKETLKRLFMQGRENGVQGMALIEKEDVQALEPNICKDVIAALHALTSGIVSPYEMVYAMMDHAIDNGVSLRLNESVGGIQKTDDGYTVATTKGTMTTKAVINCAGAGAVAIHHMLIKDDLKLTARRGEYYLLDRSSTLPFSHTIFQCPTKMGKGVLVSPTVHGNMLIGPSADDIKDSQDKATTQAALDDVKAKCLLTWPAFTLRQNITTFAGIRAHLNTDDFMIGETAPCFFEALGIESPGLTAAPAIGEALIEQVADALHLVKKERWLPPKKHPKPFSAMTDLERQQAIRSDARYGDIVCRCECVTEKEIIDAIHRPAPACTLDAVKRRTRAGMGRCQGGFCSPRVAQILSREMDVPLTAVTKSGGESKLLTGVIDGGDA